MPYTPTVYVDGSTPAVDATNLNKLENAAAQMAYAPDGTSGQVPVANGSGGLTWKKITSAEVNTSAAIPATALAGYPGDATKLLRGDGTWAAASTSSSQLDYAQITASTAAITATTEGAATAVITGNSVTYDGTAVKVEFWVPKITLTNSDSTLVFLRDSSVLGQSFIAHSTGANTAGAQKHEILDTPSAGSHTYSVAAFVSANSVTFVAGAGGSGAFAPAFLRVVRA